MSDCIVVSWPVVVLVLAVTAPRLVAEWRNGWHSDGASDLSDGDSRS